MKNGINVAAVSELVHEIRHVEGENEIYYAVELQWHGGLTMEINTLPLRFGSKYVARDFRFYVDHPVNTRPSAAPTPIDYFMTGVGSCASNILVQGASYKGITVDRMQLKASAELSAASLKRQSGQVIINPSLEVELKGDGSGLQYKMMMINVSRFSPNYVTASLPNSIELHYSHNHIDANDQLSFGDDALDLHLPALQILDENTHLTQGIQLKWRNGTQFDAVLLPRFWKNKQWLLDCQFSIDQPIAALGLNEAPNPQEYLLASVVSDVAQQLVIACQEKSISLLSLSASMHCRLDMKGFFNIFKKSAVQLQDNLINIQAASLSSEHEMRECLDLAKQRSVCWQSFVNACSVKLQKVNNLEDEKLQNATEDESEYAAV